MKKRYIRPETDKIILCNERLLTYNSEEEWGSWIGAKENDFAFEDIDDEDPWSGSEDNKSLWGED